MSLATYNKLVGRPRAESDKPELPIESQAMLRAGIQQQSDWIRNARTQEVFKQIGDEITKLEAMARTLAVQFPQHQNPHGIVHYLVRAEELRNLIKTYGRISTTTQEGNGTNQS